MITTRTNAAHEMMAGIFSWAVSNIIAIVVAMSHEVQEAQCGAMMGIFKFWVFRFDLTVDR